MKVVQLINHLKSYNPMADVVIKKFTLSSEEEIEKVEHHIMQKKVIIRTKI